jgi:hypothetical protein
MSLASRAFRRIGWKGLVPLALTLLLAVGVAWAGFGRAVSAQAAGDALAGLPAPDASTAGPFGCTIANIAVFSSRIHVFCSSAPGGTTIRYFAASGDAAHALTTNRFMVMLNTAYSLGKPVYIYYDTDTANNPPGCGGTDCRAISWMFIVP